jgi:L-fuconate dehydratase
MARITGFETLDVRFPTSRTLAGSDAMNQAPDYSAAYVIIRTDVLDLSGHGFAFTIGRGNEVQLAAIRLLEPFLAGQDLDEVLADLGGLGRRLVSDSPLHWLGPSCGVVHMATGAVLNACWDLAARRAGKPLWLLLAEMSPKQIAGLVDFRYLSDALTPDEALVLLERGAAGRAARIATLRRDGYPAYSTGPGWLGYSDEKLAALCEQAVAEGFTQVKIKVGAALDDDRRRCGRSRTAVGDDIGLAIDANQVWDVPTAIAWVTELAPFRPAWVEEPTAPGDILGTAAIRRGVRPVPVATGEHVANPVMFKQLLQAGAIDIMQIDACRVAGVNENIANLLLAAKFGVPVCPHAGGVGLCEIVQHLSMFDYAALSGTTQGRRIEWIDHLHEHFAVPAVVRRGRYRAPETPGASTEILPQSLAEYAYPDGPAWQPRRAWQALHRTTRDNPLWHSALLPAARQARNRFHPISLHARTLSPACRDEATRGRAARTVGSEGLRRVTRRAVGSGRSFDACATDRITRPTGHTSLDIASWGHRRIDCRETEGDTGPSARSTHPSPGQGT